MLEREVVRQRKPRHRHQEFLGFLKHLDPNLPAELEVHLIADNYATHKDAGVKAWLTGHPRYHMHCTPTYASWLNQVERSFGLTTHRAIRRGLSRSVKALLKRLGAYLTNHSLHLRPFVWTASAESILAKLQRLCEAINGHHLDNSSRELSEEIVVSQASQKTLRFLLRLEPPSG